MTEIEGRAFIQGMSQCEKKTLHAFLISLKEERRIAVETRAFGACTTLGELMCKVDNATRVFIEVNGERMELTPHRLALYAGHSVREIAVYRERELEVELEIGRATSFV